MDTPSRIIKTESLRRYLLEVMRPTTLLWHFRVEKSPETQKKIYPGKSRDQQRSWVQGTLTKRASVAAPATINRCKVQELKTYFPVSYYRTPKTFTSKLS